jgi:lipid II:glycine glycyltransferase (peptidoglycan interpeptide bridge formation enzyme)
MTRSAPDRLDVRPIDAARHLAYIRGRPGASYLQCPSWGPMPPRWQPESVGWFDGDRLCGVALALYRTVPLAGSLAYVGEGPVLDWAELGASAVTRALLAYLRSRGVFSVKLAPDLVRRRWRVATLRQAVRDGGAQRLRDLEPDDVDDAATAVVEALRAEGWRQYDAPAAGFGGTMHPRYRSHVPVGDADTLARGLDASWRRNLRRAAASGVTVSLGGAADLPAFHRIYSETAERDRFAPLPLLFFERMWHHLGSEDPSRIRLYLATRDGELLSAAVRTRVGDRVSYTHGASTGAGRSWRPSNALQWRMLTDAATDGAAVYDLRGISDTLDPADPLFGLLRFKLGLGGDAVELVGEWDYPLRPLRHRAVAAYLDRRSG